MTRRRRTAGSTSRSRATGDLGRYPLYLGLDLERLNAGDEHERTFLLEAQHLEMEEAL